MQVVPDPLNVTTVRFAKRLKANDFHFSQLQQDIPFWSSLLHGCRHETPIQLDNRAMPAFPHGWGKNTRRETTSFLREVFGAQANPSRVACKTLAGSQSEA